jgi:hypothetical protein
MFSELEQLLAPARRKLPLVSPGFQHIPCVGSTGDAAVRSAVVDTFRPAC